MRISDAYYTCGIREKKRNGIVRSIEKDKSEKGVFVVILPVYGKDLLEIYEYDKLLEVSDKAGLTDICVVGIAKDYDCACDLVTEVIQDVYDSFGTDMDVKKFFDEHAEGVTEL